MVRMPNTNPISAWKSLREGNERFVSGTQQHPSQGIAHRAKLVEAQHPTAVIFGCGDSRVAAELIFDAGLGDMFVVRTAGHVVDPSVLGSIEYAVEVLNVPLIVVLGHDKCGAVKATIDALDNERGAARVHPQRRRAGDVVDPDRPQGRPDHASTSSRPGTWSRPAG